MNPRTQAIIGVTVLMLGVGVYALGFLASETTVRYVHDLHADPAAHMQKTYTVLGIPQPPTLANQGGATNPAFDEATVTAVRWRETGAGREGTVYVATLRFTIASAGDGWTWFLHNTTKTTGSATVVAESWQNGTLAPGGVIFQLDDFETGDTVWAWFDGPLRDPILPKPSQLTGNLRAGLPPGALLYDVEPDGFTVGCSSKFLPDDVRAEYDPDGDGYADGQ
jgi:hypothetical protein